MYVQSPQSQQSAAELLNQALSAKTPRSQRGVSQFHMAERERWRYASPLVYSKNTFGAFFVALRYAELPVQFLAHRFSRAAPIAPSVRRRTPLFRSLIVSNASIETIFTSLHQPLRHLSVLFHSTVFILRPTAVQYNHECYASYKRFTAETIIKTGFYYFDCHWRRALRYNYFLGTFV